MVLVVGLSFGGPLGVLEYAALLLLGALAVAGLALTARCLLGVNVGLVRTIVAGAAGYVIALLAGNAVAPPRTHKLLFLPVLIGIASSYRPPTARVRPSAAQAPTRRARY